MNRKTNMKQPRLVICWMNTLVAMLLLFATAVRPLATQPTGSKTEKAPATTQAQGQSEASEPAFVSELAHDAVFSAVLSYDFNQDFCTLVRPALFDQQTATSNRPLTEPHFYFSYFRKIFTHHIAINAP